jgi:hypothetical protein
VCLKTEKEPEKKKQKAIAPARKKIVACSFFLCVYYLSIFVLSTTSPCLTFEIEKKKAVALCKARCV